MLRNAFEQGKLSFHGKLEVLADAGEFQRRLAASAQTEWVVYAKPPFGGPEQVLKYLARTPTGWRSATGDWSPWKTAKSSSTGRTTRTGEARRR